VKRTLVVLGGLLFLSGVASANTYTVTSTADSGAGTLRQAILDANANPGADTIAFNIAGSGVHLITPATALPVISDAVTIDGYTQAGSSANTNSVGQGLNTVLTIEVAGGLGVSASNTTIRGLVIHDGGVTFNNGAFSNNKVEGCFLGTDPTGTQRIGTSGTQVSVTGESGATIGGPAAAARNLVAVCQSGVTLAGAGTGHTVEGNLFGLAASGNALLTPACPGTTFALNFNGTGSFATDNVIAGGSNGLGVNGTGHTFKGNFVGTDATGTVLFGVAEHAFAVNGTNHVIGGTGADDGNVVAGAQFYNGLELNGSGHVVYGNFIGTDRTGTIDLGNNHAGVVAAGNDLRIGGTGPGEGNTIAFNAVTNYAGVLVQGQHVRIRGNSIHDNKNGVGLGIDLFVGNAAGVTPNDDGDADAGPNGSQNYPILISAGPAAPQGSGTHVTGVLNSTPSTTFDLDFYSNPACAPRPQEYLEGQDYIGSTQVTTDGSGNASFDVTLATTVEAGARITATATDPDGSTSEFSQRLVFSMTPRSGPPAGGTSVTIQGMLLDGAATVSIGGQPATNVDVTGTTQITATSPALAAGSLNDVVVANPDGTGGTLVNGWVADFLDVPPSQQFYTTITRLVSNAITVGCGGGNYCPLSSVTRQQMAVFLLKASRGLCYTPPPCTGVFPDVPCPSVFANWIEALAEAGITGGCGGGNYCPTSPVTRQQMSVFLLKTKHGSTYVPPACTGDFADVPCPSQFADWIEQLAAEGITGGCGGANYCPTQAVRRDQMAAFLYNTFQLP